MQYDHSFGSLALSWILGMNTFYYRLEGQDELEEQTRYEISNLQTAVIHSARRNYAHNKLKVSLAPVSSRYAGKLYLEFWNGCKCECMFLCKTHL